MPKNSPYSAACRGGKGKKRSAFTLVEIMIVVAIIAVLAAVAIPNFMKYRKTSQSSICVRNLWKIYAGKEQLALAGRAITTENLYGKDGIIKSEPRCPLYPEKPYSIGEDMETDPACDSEAANDPVYPHILFKKEQP